MSRNEESFPNCLILHGGKREGKTNCNGICDGCGFDRTEDERRKKLPLRVNPETGLRFRRITDKVE